jgi:hypothetical protein
VRARDALAQFIRRHGGFSLGGLARTHAKRRLRSDISANRHSITLLTLSDGG